MDKPYKCSSCIAVEICDSELGKVGCAEFLQRLHSLSNSKPSLFMHILLYEELVEPTDEIYSGWKFPWNLVDKSDVGKVAHKCSNAPIRRKVSGCTACKFESEDTN